VILRVPSGIKGLDEILEGGFPMGSFILLVGLPDTSKEDFLYTLSARLSRLNGSFLSGNQVLPDRIWYLTLTTTKEEVMQDVQGKFSEDFCRAFSKSLFRPFWELPSSLGDLAKWLRQANGKRVRELKEKIFSDFSKFLERETPNSLLILFSLNDFAMFFREEEKLEFLAVLEEVKGSVKKWGTLLLASLVPGVLDSSLEAGILSRAEGILYFRKEQDGREILACEKLPGSLLEGKRFQLQVTREGVDLSPL